MQTVRPSWEFAWEVSAALTVVGLAMAPSTRSRIRAIGAFVRETAVIGVLYGLWQLAGEVSVHDRTGAFDRARWIDRFEHDVHLPSEAGIQQLAEGHHTALQAANLYYAAMHLTMLLVFLAWLFIRHRDRYRYVRTVMAVTTLGVLLVALMPVAPPRMLPGFVDTAALYGQSVYSSGLPFDQLSAMPSMHVGWAVLIGYYTWRISPSRWRWLGPAHAVITVAVVVVTGNHWWLDGIVAVAILVTAAWIVTGVRAAWRRSQGVPGSPDDLDRAIPHEPGSTAEWSPTHRPGPPDPRGLPGLGAGVPAEHLRRADGRAARAAATAVEPVAAGPGASPDQGGAHLVPDPGRG
jgi:PAP2 superfamily protein